ncbi:TPA: hypothetical protein F8S47_08800 [Legionella pneumophila]|nr:hypothetical protein [Legionella pneumophila subsp. pneumophila]HAU1042977.1 hypothetical protein [Legionella pneumophila]
MVAWFAGLFYLPRLNDAYIVTSRPVLYQFVLHLPIEMLLHHFWMYFSCNIASKLS